MTKFKFNKYALHKWLCERDNMLVYIVMIELNEVLKKIEVERDVNPHIALHKSLDYSGDFMA